MTRDHGRDKEGLLKSARATLKSDIQLAWSQVRSLYSEAPVPTYCLLSRAEIPGMIYLHPFLEKRSVVVASNVSRSSKVQAKLYQKGEILWLHSVSPC